MQELTSYAVQDTTHPTDLGEACGGKGQNHPWALECKMTHGVDLDRQCQALRTEVRVDLGKKFLFSLSPQWGDITLCIGPSLTRLFLGPAPPRDALRIGRSMAVDIYTLQLVTRHAGRSTVGVLSVRAACTVTYLREITSMIL